MFYKYYVKVGEPRRCTPIVLLVSKIFPQKSHEEGQLMLKETGWKISFAEAYPHPGQILQGLAFYDYMSILKLKRKGKEVGGLGEIEFQSAWVFSAKWVQELRKPGKFAMVCLGGYLTMDVSEDEEQYYRRYG